MPTSEKPPQVAKFTPLYENFTRTLRPVVREVLNNDQVDRAVKVKEANKAVSSIRNLTSQMFEVLDEPQKKEVAKLIAKAEETKSSEDRAAMEARLRDLFPGEFTNKTYHSFVDAIAETTNAILAGYGKDLKDVPKTFGEILVSATRQKAREVLAGTESAKVPELAVVEEEGTHEKEAAKAAPRVSTPKENQKFEEWKKGWFEDEINLQKLDEVKKQLVVRDDEHGKKFADFTDFSNRGIMEIDNFDELREVAVLRLAAMYATNEVNEESFRRENFDIIWMQAEKIRQKMKKEGKDTDEYAKYTKKMIDAMREFYVFWNEGWIGMRTTTGVGVDIKTVATFAGRFPDQQKYWEFLLEQKAVNNAFHREITGKSAQEETEKINSREAKSELWKIVGRRLRRSTGAAIYDGIGYIKDVRAAKTLEEIRLSHKKKGEETDEESNRRLDMELANEIFKINGMRPHTIDYVLFLNHFIPWYLDVRYRQKFKDRVDLLERLNKNSEDLARRLDLEGTQVPRLMSDEALNRVKESFRNFNIGEIAAYSMWKRPDTSGTWLDNLKQVRIAAEAFKSGDPTEFLEKHRRDLEGKKQKELDKLGTTPKEKPKTKENIDNINADFDLKIQYEVKKVQEILDSFGGNRDLLQKFIETGLNFGMKLISFYEPEMDRRSGKLKSLSNWGSFGINDWGYDNLKGQAFDRKLQILQNFLDPNVVVTMEQHEIIRNNLIRTVPITQEVEKELQEKSLALQSWYRMSLFQEYVDLDDLRLEDADDSWLRFFNNGSFSFNAFMIYEGYASATREDIHKMFSVEDSDIQSMLKLAKGLESMTKFKHVVDTSLAEFSPETGGYKELKQATAWRIERSVRAIEEYVSALYMLTIATYRKMGVRGPLAENVNQIVANGIKDGFFKSHHFEPAMSERENQEGLELSYGKIENHQKMGNDFKLRYLLNLLGFEGNEQRIIWEKGFLHNVSEKYKKQVSYDVLLLMAGLRERTDAEMKASEIRGYMLDGPVANGWYDFYVQNRMRGDILPQTQSLKPEFVQLLVERARQLPQFSGKSDVEIRQGLDTQFAILHNAFNDRIEGLFSGIMMYQRNLAFVYEQVIDAFIGNTFDRNRAYATGDPGQIDWPKRKWDASLDYVAREKYKSELARRRRFAIAGGEGFNRYLLTQVVDGKFVNPYDRINYETDAAGNIIYKEGRPVSKYLHGIDDIESWLMGSGELDFGKAKRLTRLPNYWNAQGLYFLYRAIYAPATAVAAHANSMSPEWEDGEIRSFKDRRVLMGPWINVINPEKWRRLLESFKDPFGESIMGWDQIEELSVKSGCTTYQIGKFHDEREWRKVMDLEVGPDAALTKEEQEGLGFLDRPASLIVELPGTVGGAELGGLFGLKELWKNITQSGSVGRATALANAVPVALLGAAVGGAGLLSMGPIAGGLLAAVAGGLLFTGPTISVNDEEQIKRNFVVKALFDLKFPWWGNVAKNSPRIPLTNIPLFNLPIIGGTILGSIRNLKKMGRDSEVLLAGNEPVWDDLVAIKPIVEDFKWEKEHLKVDADYFTKAKS